MRAVFLWDLHLTDDSKKPRNRKPGYTEQLLEKVRFAANLAKEKNCPLVQLGDWFNLKSAVSNSHKLVQQSHEALCGVRTFIVPGNHDTTNHRLDSLSKQPLGSLCRMKNVELLLGKHPELEGIAGIPFLPEFEDARWKDAVIPWFEKCKGVHTVATHMPMFPPGREPGVYFSIPAREWAELASQYEIHRTFYGHIHENHEKYEVSGHTFVNLGATSRGSLERSSTTRIPRCYFVDGEHTEIFILPHLPPEEVFDFDAAIKKTTNKANAEEFSKLVGTVAVERLTIENVQAMLKEQASSQQVYDIIEQVLER